jgi:hypothetical protein
VSIEMTQGGLSMKRVLTVVAVAVLAVVGASTLYAQNNAVVGKWTLNLAKSKFDPGPAPKSLTRTVVTEGDGLKYTFEGVGADGKALSYGFTVKFDGKGYPVTGSMPAGADSISVKRVDANNYEATLKKGGKVVGTSKVTVSTDGKVTTVEANGTNAAGAKTHDVQVYDKQ